MATTERPRRWQLRAAAASVAALTGLSLTGFMAGGAHAATTEAAGWWSSTSSPLPVNPTAPQAADGQLHVQGSPQGPSAIAAVRWTLAEGESSPRLTLTPAQGSLVPDTAVVLACPATAPWQEANGAPMAEAPASDCTTQAAGTVAPGGTSIEFDLTPLVKDTVLDVVLQPGTTPEGAGSTFSLTFDRPGPEALTTTPAPTASEPVGPSDGSTSSPGDETTPAPSSTSAEGASAGAGSGASTGSFSTPTGAGAGSSFSAAPLTVPTPTPTPPAPTETSAQPAQSAAGTGTGTSGTAAGAAAASKADEANDRAKKLGAVILLAGVAVLGWAWTATDPAAAGRVKAAVATAKPLFTRRPVTQ